MVKKRFQIQDMHCVGCAMTIDGVVEDLPGVKSATTSFARQAVDIEFEEKKVTEQQIISAIQAAGYRVAPIAEQR
jgi:copper chaperone CopZ